MSAAKDFNRVFQADFFLDVMHGEDDDMAVDHGAAAAVPELPVSSMLPSLVSPLLSLLQPTALSFPPLAAPSIHPPTTSALSVIHVSALECLNNLFLSLAASHKSCVSSDKEAGLTVWNGVWSAVKLVGMEMGLGQERRQEIREVAIGVLWGVGNVWKGLIVRQAYLSRAFFLYNKINGPPRFRNPSRNKSDC